ncbi:hypothetical protein RC52_03240 [Herbaspirillum rubrisubalbicans]|uniref:Uncharacterized protein n=1 Tax=Herbaspirillum rubrisubalbicans TaxID=80842 RepID=A0AAD0UA42_9BURK|nr:hypothetical protein RC54_15215 [Herbaspirillum rubrisubalbicans]NQE47518.1 hypothetical protein [Herbaspirillum rubrisubalbicans]
MAHGLSAGRRADVELMITHISAQLRHTMLNARPPQAVAEMQAAMRSSSCTPLQSLIWRQT